MVFKPHAAPHKAVKKPAGRKIAPHSTQHRGFAAATAGGEEKKTTKKTTKTTTTTTTPTATTTTTPKRSAKAQQLDQLLNKHQAEAAAIAATPDAPVVAKKTTKKTTTKAAAAAAAATPTAITDVTTSIPDVAAKPARKTRQKKVVVPTQVIDELDDSDVDSKVLSTSSQSATTSIKQTKAATPTTATTTTTTTTSSAYANTANPSAEQNATERIHNVHALRPKLNPFLGTRATPEEVLKQAFNPDLSKAQMFQKATNRHRKINALDLTNSPHTPTGQQNINTNWGIQDVIKFLSNQKISQMVVFDTTMQSPVCDYTIVCNVPSAKPMQALVQKLVAFGRMNKGKGHDTYSAGDDPDGLWAVAELGHMVVHVLTPAGRTAPMFQRVERKLLNDAKLIAVSSWPNLLDPWARQDQSLLNDYNAGKMMDWSDVVAKNPRLKGTPPPPGFYIRANAQAIEPNYDDLTDQEQFDYLDMNENHLNKIELMNEMGYTDHTSSKDQTNIQIDYDQIDKVHFGKIEIIKPIAHTAEGETIGGGDVEDDDEDGSAFMEAKNNSKGGKKKGTASKTSGASKVVMPGATKAKGGAKKSPLDGGAARRKICTRAFQAFTTYNTMQDNELQQQQQQHKQQHKQQKRHYIQPIIISPPVSMKKPESVVTQQQVSMSSSTTSSSSTSTTKMSSTSSSTTTTTTQTQSYDQHHHQQQQHQQPQQFGRYRLDDEDGDAGLGLDFMLLGAQPDATSKKAPPAPWTTAAYSNGFGPMSSHHHNHHQHRDDDEHNFLTHGSDVLSDSEWIDGLGDITSETHDYKKLNMSLQDPLEEMMRPQGQSLHNHHHQQQQHNGSIAFSQFGPGQHHQLRTFQGFEDDEIDDSGEEDFGQEDTTGIGNGLPMSRTSPLSLLDEYESTFNQEDQFDPTTAAATAAAMSRNGKRSAHMFEGYYKQGYHGADDDEDVEIHQFSRLMSSQHMRGGYDFHTSSEFQSEIDQHNI